ncbi:MAG: hypothetical protein ACO2ZZ_02795 [Cyclobacteriaceae bacterium]
MSITKHNIVSLFALVLCVFTSRAQDIYDNTYQWQIPGGKYIDPVSFFSLHGYVNAVYAGPSEDWMQGNFNGIGMPGQVIVPNTNLGSFSNDEALWISSELDNFGSVVVELHLVNDPSGRGAAGPGGLTIVLTEANLRYQLIQEHLAISAGTFWSVFGIQNQDWLGAQNLFSTIPLASGAYPTHFNEKGLRLDGSFGKGDWGLNYVASVGNGFNAFDISGYTSFDLNENKMFNGRVSLFPGLGEGLNVGVSYASGLLASATSHNDSLGQGAYDNLFQAFGTDLTWSFKNLKFRGYRIASRERLEKPKSQIDLNHLGMMGELSYSFELTKSKSVDALVPKIRFDYLDKSQFSAENNDQYNSVSFGLNIRMHEDYLLSMDYSLINEEQLPLNNNRLIARFSASF